MNPNSLSPRREFLRTLSLSALGGAFLLVGTVAQTAGGAAVKKEVADVPMLNRFPRMMQDWLVTEVAQEKDYFDARGSAETYERLKKLYTLLGKPENIQLHVGPDPHGYTQANREAMYRFFGKVT